MFSGWNIFDLTKYVLLTIIHYVHWSKNYQFQNNVNLSRMFVIFAFSSFMHIYNISVTYLQNIKIIHWKLLKELISQCVPY